MSSSNDWTMDSMDTSTQTHEYSYYHGPPSDEECEEDRMVAEAAQHEQHNMFTQKVSLEEYEKQKKKYTAEAVEALMKSDEYLQRVNRCYSCWSSWLHGDSTDYCMECGGFPLQRPCPVCQGKCGRIWNRDVETTHSFHEAHWMGSCGLPIEEQEAFMLAAATEADEETVIDALQDLSTS